MISKKIEAVLYRPLYKVLTARGISDVQIANNSEYDSTNPTRQIPTIHYGVIGINQYEKIDCVHGLNSYSVTEGDSGCVLQDMPASDEQLEMEITGYCYSSPVTIEVPTLGSNSCQALYFVTDNFIFHVIVPL
ncbi:hypothetical protein [Photobacterium sp.]|uniref:hypothetical protein n=1 Tax=Photobacterium sp. TaxID=660 RepID=UPI00299E13AC|nr:hypothetical protein [Photobacterium sp.]MDX1301575.1 hypothetical protein [Photobacterium sp.]